MNAGYKGVFLLINNKNIAAEHELQEGKKRDNSVFGIYH